MVYGMIEVVILLFVLIVMLIGKEVWMIEKTLVEEHSFLEEDWFLGSARNKIVFHRVL